MNIPGYCLYVHIFIHISHLNRLILTILINLCQTSGFRKVGAIIKYNIMHFPVLIKTVLKLVYIICKIMFYSVSKTLPGAKQNLHISIAFPRKEKSLLVLHMLGIVDLLE